MWNKSIIQKRINGIISFNTKQNLQFIQLPKNYDPDSFINKFSLSNLLKSKKPIPIVEYMNQSSSAIDLTKADNKISLISILMI